MKLEDYKELIIKIIKNSNDISYIIAVYSFVDSYPDMSINKNMKES